MTDPFDEFWGAYPKRLGGNPKHAARVSFERAIRQRLATPADMIGAVARFSAECRTLKTIGTPFVPMATTWLNQRRYRDYPALAPTASPDYVWIAMDDPEWSHAAASWRATHGGKSPPTVPGLRGMGWKFPTRLHPAQPEKDAALSAGTRSKPLMGWQGPGSNAKPAPTAEERVEQSVGNQQVAYKSDLFA